MLLEVEGLTRDFDGLRAVDGVDFHVNEGELLAIIGPNGAGKTTLFNLISGMCHPTAGKITFRGEVITGCKPYQVAARGIKRTFQTTALFDQLRVFDNLAIGRRTQIKTGFWDALWHTPRWKRERDETAALVLETGAFIGLKEKMSSPVSTLTQEEQKRLAIGIALAGKPELILLDEPTGGINPAETGNLIGLIRKIRQAGITVCLIEHKMRMVMGLADRIVVLNYGRKIAEGTPAEVSKNRDVIAAYLGGRSVAQT